MLIALLACLPVPQSQKCWLDSQLQPVHLFLVSTELLPKQACIACDFQELSQKFALNFLMVGRTHQRHVLHPSNCRRHLLTVPPNFKPLPLFCITLTSHNSNCLSNSTLNSYLFLIQTVAHVYAN